MNRLFVNALVLILVLLGTRAAAMTNWTEEAENAFGRIPLLYDGRVMPMNQYARLHLLQLRGKDKMEDQSAAQWMARLLFSPTTTENEPLFLIDHPEVLDAMGADRTEMFEGAKKPSSRRFSYSHLEPGLEVLDQQASRASALEDGQRSLADKEFLRVRNSLFAYLSLNQAFEFARPQIQFQIESPELRTACGLDDTVKMLSYLELKQHGNMLLNYMQEAGSHGGVEMEKLTEPQREAFRLSMAMYQMGQSSVDLNFLIIPSAPHGKAEWLNPMAALHDGIRDVERETAIRATAALATAFALGDMDAFVKHANALETFSVNRMKKYRDVQMVASEARFHQKAPLKQAKVWYIFALSFSILAVVVRRRAFRVLAGVPLLIGIGYHITGLVWRVLITGRPPVTNLYGTFIFVGLVCVLLALLIEWRQKNGMGIFVGALIVTSFLLIAERFAVEGDTMRKVVAVLASNFWLSTHVICISIGYAFCWIAGVFGHIWLVQRALRRPADELKDSMAALNGLLGFGLSFAFLGTMLGGVWGDQSWGRFWGWDPKENGALLIVLWTAVIYHARIAGMIRDRGVAVGASLGCIVVMLAWQGVNLLGVGLHNYGFNNALALGMIGYLVFEILFLFAVLTADRVRTRRA